MSMKDTPGFTSQVERNMDVITYSLKLILNLNTAND